MRLISPSFLLFLLVAVASAPLGAQDRNIAVRPGNAPEIEILEPAEWRGETTRNIAVRPRNSVRVVGLASHSSGITEVTIDGARASLRPDPSGATRFTGYVRGETTGREVVVVARTGSGRELTARFGMEAGEQLGAPPADPAAAWGQSADFRGERWAVVVGISDYADSDITPLRYADDDALAFYSFLVSENAGLGGFKEENVLLLLNEQATFRNIRFALRDFLKQATDDDVVVVYFAGHGAPDPDRPDNLYLITHDTDSERVASTGFPMADVDEAIRDTYARSVITITDACHSAGVGGQGLRAGERMNLINQAFLDRLNTSTGVLVSFTASQANQYSQEHERWGGGHGVFTHYMLRALEGEGDEDGDGIVSLGEMMEWTRDRVRRETRNAQIPTISQTAFDWSWPMAVVTGEEIPVLAEAPEATGGLAPAAPAPVASASGANSGFRFDAAGLRSGAWQYRLTDENGEEEYRLQRLLTSVMVDGNFGFQWDQRLVRAEESMRGEAILGDGVVEEESVIFSATPYRPTHWCFEERSDEHLTVGVVATDHGLRAQFLEWGELEQTDVPLPDGGLSSVFLGSSFELALWTADLAGSDQFRIPFVWDVRHLGGQGPRGFKNLGIEEISGPWGTTRAYDLEMITGMRGLMIRMYVQEEVPHILLRMEVSGEGEVLQVMELVSEIPWTPQLSCPFPEGRLARLAEVESAGAPAAAEDVTITPTTFEDNPVEDLPPPPENQSPNRAFTTYAVAPQLRNDAEVRRILSAEYPPALRDGGIEGTTLVSLLIGQDGGVVRAVIAEGSGYDSLDEAALNVAQAMEFTPAEDADGEPVRVWVQLPVNFQVN